jgi:trans-aconitate methyltransferase
MHNLNIYNQNNKNFSKHLYFQKQIKKPYQSTVSFFNFLKKYKLINSSIVDLGCGNGANLYYLQNKFKVKKKLLGIDKNQYLIDQAKKKFHLIKNLNFKKKNILKIGKEYKNIFDGAISLQNLSFLEDYKETIKNINSLNVNFIAVSSLFWEGLIDFKIKVNFLEDTSHKRNVRNFSYYNIYSIKNYINLMKKLGYSKNYFIKFNPEKKINFKDKKKMGTYTVNLKNKLMQISGPIIMNWYFILSVK